MEHLIKRGATLYSFGLKYNLKQLTLEDMLAALSKLGITGIECLGQQFFPNCPEPNPAAYDTWNELMWKYGTKPVAHDFFVDRTLYRHRELTVREGTEIVARHLRFAKSCGMRLIRMGGTVRPEVFRQAIPYCEEYDVKLGLEIHNGSSSFLDPSVQQVIEVIRSCRSPYLGIVPDMSLFVKKIGGKQSTVTAFAAKVDPKLMNEICLAYENEPNEAFRTRCAKYLADGVGGKDAIDFLLQAQRTEYHDPKELLEHMPYIIHFHGKFWEMDADCNETTIDYANVMPVLIEGGYEGYISSEYEGRGDNPIEQLRRHQVMLDRYLGKYPALSWPVEKPVDDTEPLSVRGFRNHYEDGRITGFEVGARSLYYRGVPLALFDDCNVTVDGIRYGPDKIKVEVDGEVFRFSDLETVTTFCWNYGDLLTLIVDKPGGLDTQKKHEVRLDETIRTFYTPRPRPQTATKILTLEE